MNTNDEPLNGQKKFFSIYFMLCLMGQKEETKNEAANNYSRSLFMVVSTLELQFQQTHNIYNVLKIKLERGLSRQIVCMENVIRREENRS